MVINEEKLGVALPDTRRILAEHSELSTISGTAEEVRTSICDAVFGDINIQTDYAGMDIRMTTQQAAVAAEIAALLGQPELVKKRTIGDIESQADAKEVMLGDREYAGRLYGSSTDTRYDPASNAPLDARKLFFNILNNHYGFQPKCLERLIKQTTITAGGMSALHTIAGALVLDCLKKGLDHAFVSGDSAYPTWIAMTNDESRNGRDSERHIIRTQQKNLLHLSPEDVACYYEYHSVPPGKRRIETWYLTPVGNPSGTMMLPEQLEAVCKKIINGNPDTVIVIDCAYVRTLRKEDALRLMKAIVTNEAIMEHSVFVESFSKSDGFCGDRVGAFFTANPDLYAKIHNKHMQNTAGQGKLPKHLIRAIHGRKDSEKQIMTKMHEHWAEGRRKMYQDLIVSNQYPDLFDDDQSHILPEQLAMPCGLYLTLRLKQGVNAKQVAKRTGYFGVNCKMACADYVRFSFGIEDDAEK